jgi:hypothetical protein
MKKLAFVIIFFCFCFNILFAFTRGKEQFIIHNLTNDTINIKYEFFAEPILYEGTPIFDGRAFHQHINGINISIYNDLYVNQIASGQKVVCISYYPSDALISVWENKDYERLKEIPILTKIRAIFKSFTITDMEGNIINTLETLSEDKIKEEGTEGPFKYILEIYKENQN